MDEKKEVGAAIENGSLTDNVSLREVTKSDLPLFFDFQRDAAANEMASVPARSRAAFDTYWEEKRFGDKTAVTRTILFDGNVAGFVLSWQKSEQQVVGYWLGQAFWGKGIATKALTDFLPLVTMRPLYAHIAKHNIASLRVLEKCGFEIAQDEKLPFGTEYDDAGTFILKLTI